MEYYFKGSIHEHFVTRRVDLYIVTKENRTTQIMFQGQYMYIKVFTRCVDLNTVTRRIKLNIVKKQSSIPFGKPDTPSMKLVSPFGKHGTHFGRPAMTDFSDAWRLWAAIQKSKNMASLSFEIRGKKNFEKDHFSLLVDLREDIPMRPFFWFLH